jgi:hypothetical protein
LDEKNLYDTQFLAVHHEDVEESKHRRFMAVFVHLISLLHAVALATLSGDLDAQNIVVCPSPPIPIPKHCPTVHT